MEKFTEKNLISQTWWNPFTAVATNGNGYELDAIIFYNENGELAQTNGGWFQERYNNNNSFKEGATISEIHLRKNVDFSKKENFIVKDNERTYETRYKLYIYYKNVNFKPLEITSGNYFIEGLYSIELPEKSIVCEDVYGNTQTKSDAIKYTYYKTIEEIEKQKYSSNINELKKLIKKLNKQIKQYEEMKEKEPEDIKNNIDPYLYENGRKMFYNFKNLLEKGGE